MIYPQKKCNLMSQIKKAAIASFLLHITIFLLIFFSPFSSSKVVKHENKQFIVDFVKIGPQSAAPMLGPQMIAQKQKAKNESEKKASLQSSSSVSESAPSVASNPEKQQKEKINKKEEKIKKAKELEKKPVPKVKQKIALEQTIAKKDEKTKKDEKKVTKIEKNIKKTAKKSKSANSTVNKAKVDLAKKGNAINKSMKDYFGKSNTKNADVTNNAAFAETLGTELTGTDIDMLNRHMKQFWNIPSGHEKAHSIVVEIELFIRKDRTVEKANIVDQKRLYSDPEFRIAAESALRAVLDPECSPLPLDSDKYEQWKHMIFVFDPSEMCSNF
jgi:membrane protein involved in colicin uptake